jgi:hypothetical protein
LNDYSSDTSRKTEHRVSDQEYDKRESRYRQLVANPNHSEWFIQDLNESIVAITTGMQALRRGHVAKKNGDRSQALKEYESARSSFWSYKNSFPNRNSQSQHHQRCANILLAAADAFSAAAILMKRTGAESRRALELARQAASEDVQCTRA